MTHEDKPCREIDDAVERRLTPEQVKELFLHPTDDVWRLLQDDEGTAGKDYRKFIKATANNPECDVRDHAIFYLTSDGLLAFRLIPPTSTAPARPKKVG